MVETRYMELAKLGLKAFKLKGKKKNSLLKAFAEDLEHIVLLTSGAIPALNKDHYHLVGVNGKKKDHVAYRPAKLVTALHEGGKGDKRVLVYEGEICGFAKHDSDDGYIILKYFR